MPIQPSVVLSSACWRATEKTRRSLRSIEERHSAARQVIVSTDVNTTGDAEETRTRSRLGCCHFHSFTFFSLLVIYSYFLPSTLARPFSLVGGGNEDINGIQGSNRFAEIWTKQGSSAVNALHLQLPHISSQTQRLVEQQQLQQLRKLFSEKTNLYQDEPKDKHYSYADQEEAPVPEEYLNYSAKTELATAASAELTTEAETEYNDNMGQTTTDAATSKSSAITDHTFVSLDGRTKTASERSPRKHEEKPSSVTLVNEDNTAETSPGKIHTSTMIASVPIQFQAKPFVVSPAISPEINDQIAPQRPRPIPSLLEELGPLF